MFLVVFVLSPSPQCQNIGLGGGGGRAYIYIYIRGIHVYSIYDVYTAGICIYISYIVSTNRKLRVRQVITRA